MSEHQPAKRIAVLGGGLAGLAAAHRLCELKIAQGQNFDVTLFEAGTRLGGLVGTVRIGDYLVDTGADSFLTNKPAAVGLCRRLGIEDRLVPTDPKFRGAGPLRWTACADSGRIPVTRPYRNLAHHHHAPFLSLGQNAVTDGMVCTPSEAKIPGAKPRSIIRLIHQQFSMKVCRNL